MGSRRGNLPATHLNIEKCEIEASFFCRRMYNARNTPFPNYHVLYLVTYYFFLEALLVIRCQETSHKKWMNSLSFMDNSVALKWSHTKLRAFK